MKLFAPLKPLQNSIYFVEAGLIAASLILPFGIQINRLGLYGDSWAYVINPEAGFKGMDGLIKTALIQFAGSQPVLYHLVTILFFFVIGLLFHSTLIKMKLDHVTATAIVMLFLLYPGFLQPTSGIEIIGILSGLILFFLSILAYQKWFDSSTNGIYYLITGLLCSVFCSICSVYTAVLMIFSFLFFLFWGQSSHQKTKIISILLGTSIFLAGLLSFLLQFPSKSSFNINIFIRTGRVWLNAFVVNWRQILAIPQQGNETIIYALFLLTTGFILYRLFVYINKAGELPGNDNQPEISSREILILVCSALAGFGFLFLILISGFPLETQYPNNIGMVITGIFAAIIVVLGIKLLFITKYQLAMLAIMIVMAGGARFLLINRYSAETSRVDDLLAQLAVRGDYLQSGAIFVSEQLPFDFTTQKAIDALIRKQFNVENNSAQAVYLSADNSDLRELLRNSSQQEVKLRIDERKISVNKKDIIGFWVKQGSCMQILDGKTEFTDLPEGLKLVFTVSKPELFKSNNLSDVKQLNQFRNKIKNDWCFYYQLANRYAASGNWQEVLSTYHTAGEHGLVPQSLNDSQPLLVATLMKNKFPEAVELSKEFMAHTEQKDIICKIWNEYRLEYGITEEVISEGEQAQIAIGCP